MPRTKYLSGRSGEVAGRDGAKAGVAEDPVKVALGLLQGKTTAEFNQAALQHPVLRQSQDAIISGTLLAGISAQGLAKLVDNHWQVVS